MVTAPQPQDATNPALPIRDNLTAAQRAAETLSALNWDTCACQCTAHSCAQPARYVVHVHALHRCNTPGLDPFGNRVQIRCEPCVRRLQAEVAQKLARLKPWGMPPCETCGAPIAALSDIIRELVELT